MVIFQVFIRTAAGELLQGLILAESRQAAVALAVQRTKEQYGDGSRVKLIVPLIDAGDLSRIHHVGLVRVLAELDQLRLIAWHLHKVTRSMADSVAMLIVAVRERQEREGDSE